MAGPACIAAKASARARARARSAFASFPTTALEMVLTPRGRLEAPSRPTWPAVAEAQRQLQAREGEVEVHQ